MATPVTMPALGESVTEGTVTTWLKSVGDTVAVDEPIVEVSTDKVDSEVPSPVAGVLLEILVPEDETVEVGTPIALVGDAGEVPAGAPAAAEVPASVPAVEVSAVQVPAAPTPVAEAVPAVDAGGAAASVAVAPAHAASGTEVTMPALGESVTEGTVTTWLKSVGDAVAADEPLLEVSTDKVDSEVPSPVAGYLAQILVEEDSTVEVGTVLAVISTDAPAAASSSVPAGAAVTAPVETPAPAASTAEALAAVAPAGVAEVAPAAPAAPVATPEPALATPPAHAAPEPVAPTSFDTPSVPQAPSTAPAVQPSAVAPAAIAGAGYVTPIVRKLAREADIDLSSIAGTGVGGRIRRSDVEAAIAARAAAAPAPAASAPAAPLASADAAGAAAPQSAAPVREPSPLRGTTEKMNRLRQTIARRMVDSLQTAAQLTTVVEVDVTKVAALRASVKDAFAAKHGTKLTFLPFFVKAATEALAYHPKVNATINDDNTVTYHGHDHIGIAVDTPRGLLVPVVKDATNLDIPALAGAINDLAARTRDAKVGPDELSGSTFTITNTGSGGALFDTPVLNMPETAILGVGTIVKRPVVVTSADGTEAIAVRSMVYLALSYDHRLVDGADASRYLMDVKRRLEAGDFAADLNL